MRTSTTLRGCELYINMFFASVFYMSELAHKPWKRHPSVFALHLSPTAPPSRFCVCLARCFSSSKAFCLTSRTTKNTSPNSSMLIRIVSCFGIYRAFGTDRGLRCGSRRGPFLSKGLSLSLRVQRSTLAFNVQRSRTGRIRRSPTLRYTDTRFPSGFTARKSHQRLGL
jgi:hypothetical protein